MSTTTPTKLRLTRRGRAVLTAAVAGPIAIALSFGMLSGGAAQAGNQSSVVPLQVVTLTDGQSLWSIAHEIAPNRDAREVIAQILQLNGLHSTDLPAGTNLALPRY